MFQAAWILDDSDEDDFASCDEENNGMVLDEGENGIPSDKAFNKYDFDEDQGSLDLGDSDIETETDSVMVVCLVDNLTPFSLLELCFLKSNGTCQEIPIKEQSHGSEIFML